MVIFHSYVKLPEGIISRENPSNIPWIVRSQLRSQLWLRPGNILFKSCLWKCPEKNPWISHWSFISIYIYGIIYINILIIYIYYLIYIYICTYIIPSILISIGISQQDPSICWTIRARIIPVDCRFRMVSLLMTCDGTGSWQHVLRGWTRGVVRGERRRSCHRWKSGGKVTEILEKRVGRCTTLGRLRIVRQLVTWGDVSLHLSALFE